MIEFDTILNQLGKVTRRQWIQLFLLIPTTVISAIHMAAMVFLGAELPHNCEMPLKDNITEQCNLNWTSQQTEKYIPWDTDANKLDSCSRYVYKEVNCSYWESHTASNAGNSSIELTTEKCNSWTYNTSVFTSTVVKDFDLVCEESQKGRLSQAIFMMGVTLGCAVWGQASDRFGRKFAVIAPMVVGIVFSVATAFVQTFTAFTFLRFFVGFTLFPSFSCAYVLGSESVKPNHRVWVGQSAQAFFAVGFAILALLGYYIRDWRNLQLAISIPLVGAILLSWILFESPRWLISSKKYNAADRIVKKIIKSGSNLHSSEAKKLETLSKLQKGGKQDLTKEESEALNYSEETSSSQTLVQNSSVIDIFKFPNMRKKSMILFYEWMVASCTYYGLTLNAADLGGNPFINLFLSGLVEIPASYIAIALLQKWGRRPTLISTFLVSGISCVCMMFVPKDLIWLNISLSMLGKFSIAATFGTVYIYATEIYPTPVRNVGIGICSSWARVGGMIAPFIAMLDVVGPSVPYIVFGLLSVIGGFLGMLLPEVLGITLPETLEEGEEFGKNTPGIIDLMCRRKNSNYRYSETDSEAKQDTDDTESVPREKTSELEINL